MVERIISNARNTIRDRDASQTATTGECAISNARDAIRDRDASQTATTGERITSNARNTIRDRDACQTTTTGERTTSNARHAVRDRDFFQTATKEECAISNACYASIGWNDAVLTTCNQGFAFCFNYAISIAMVFCVSTFYGNICQPATTGERIISNACYAIRYRDICQPATTGECRFSNACNAIRYRDICQPATTGERRFSNARHAIRDRDACQAGAIVECTVKDIPARNRDRFERGRDIVGGVCRGTGTTAVIPSGCRSARVTACSENIAEGILVGITCCFFRSCTNKRKCDILQTAATGKRRISNACNAVSNYNICQTATIVECTVEKITTRNRYRFERRRNIVGGRDGVICAVAVIMLCGCRPTDITASSENVTEWILIGVTFHYIRSRTNKRNCDACQVDTTRKRPL